MIELDDSKTLFSFDKDLEPGAESAIGRDGAHPHEGLLRQSAPGPRRSTERNRLGGDQPCHGPRFMSKALLRVAR